MLQPFFKGPLVQAKGYWAPHGVAAHWLVVQGGHFVMHDDTSQQLPHMRCVGQKDALAAQPPLAVPDRHWYGSATLQRSLAWQTACEHDPVHAKRAGQAAREQHDVQNFVLFHAEAVLEQPPWLAPLSQ